MVTHIVCWDFTPETDADKAVQHIQNLFDVFWREVPGMQTLEVHRGFNGYSACLISRHQNRESLQAYQDYPAHHSAKEYIHSILARRASCDFED